MRGPGKYDFFCTMVRERTRAKAVILVIIDGNQGDGMSAQIDGDIGLDIAAALEEVARDIREAEG